MFDNIKSIFTVVSDIRVNESEATLNEANAEKMKAEAEKIKAETEEIRRKTQLEYEKAKAEREKQTPVSEPDSDWATTGKILGGFLLGGAVVDALDIDVFSLIRK